MKKLPLLLAALATLGATVSFAEPDIVILDANTVSNLRLDYATATRIDFEKTVFALGRIEASHGAITTVTSRIAGRVAELSAHLGDSVEPGDIIAHVESRQVGDPPPLVPLHAPRGGVVTACEIHLGDPVEPDRHLMEITDLSEVEAVALAPQSILGHLSIGQTTARIRLSAYPGENFVGRLSRLAPAADPANGTIAAHFTLANIDGRLRPGLRAEFAIITETRAGVLAVPRAAVQGEGAGPRFVFTRYPALPHAFERSPVVIGALNDRLVEIISGLAPGDVLVNAGAYSLAFAGSGTVSLKQALDDAHGHAHAEDGSELSAGQEHDHDHADHTHAGTFPWQVATAALGLTTLTLSLALARRRHA